MHFELGLVMRVLIGLITILVMMISSTIVLAMSGTPGPVKSPGASPDTTVKFIAIGDMGTGKDGQRKVAEVMKQVCARRGCDFVVGLGDNIYEAGVDSASDIQFQTKFEEPYKNLNLRFYMALGNHDNS